MTRAYALVSSLLQPSAGDLAVGYQRLVTESSHPSPGSTYQGIAACIVCNSA
ncbi:MULTISPECIES: hypothetical protein [unclassified Streptomyces]|uniref:hypothetical protein n=1 Tax=unclassified Streptomyces TaxID=2593676 RepID=UPI002E0D221F|nr:hypothetical protein OG306_01765 [Streptomyces sp. NBC_01241]WSP66879.1 hypothetical protein OG466_37235 [Streptomyces sp. NBC_01240]WSU26033.1 hypothetical protein OG508_37525 [Streptomyces sp. NBC_01108]